MMSVSAVIVEKELGDHPVNLYPSLVGSPGAVAGFPETTSSYFKIDESQSLKLTLLSYQILEDPW